MKVQKEKTAMRIAVLLLLAVLLTCLLYQINARSPRCEVDALSSLTEMPENGPLLLTGGKLYRDETGRSCYSFSFRCAGPACLLFARGVDVTLNGENMSLQNEVYPLEPGQEYEIVVRSAENTLPYVANTVYYGSQEQAYAFLRFYAQVNTYIQGMCFTIMLISSILLLYKQSERYLLWLALLCFFRGNYRRLRMLLAVVTWIPGLDFLTRGDVYLVISELVTAVLQYKIMESFVPVRIGKLAFPWYAGFAAIPVLLLYRQPGLEAAVVLFFFLVLYACYLVCFLRMPAEAAGERSLLLTFWVATVVLRCFDEFCDLGWMPSGDVNLRFRLRGLVSMLFVTAFLVLVGKRFAQKFREADELNTLLEEKIRQKTRQQTLFVRSMLHNLKTPLFSLSGYSDMALKSMERNPDNARQYMKKAREKAIFAGELMDHIFLVTQMDADIVHMQTAPVNIGELLRAVAETPTSGQENKTLKLTLDLPAEVYLPGDQLYLRQAFQNILDNARINTPDGGEIAIRAETEGEMLAIHIADSGCGIAPEEREKIFDAYYSNRHGKQQSSGLGLYITSEIIKRHDGTISVQSEPNRGSDFVVQLPLSGSEPPSPKI